MLDYSSFSDKLDDYLLAISKRVCAEIDAGCCQTSADYKKREQAREAEGQIREELEAMIKEVTCG